MFTGSPELCLGRHHSSLGKGLIEQHLGTCEGKMAEIVAELRRWCMYCMYVDDLLSKPKAKEIFKIRDFQPRQIYSSQMELQRHRIGRWSWYWRVRCWSNPCEATARDSLMRIQDTSYCHLVWHFCKSTDSKKLERIQERALRAVYESSSETYEELLERSKLPTLYNRRLQDIKYGLVPGNVSDLFRIKDNRYLLRNSDFEIPCFNTVRHGKHSVRYLGPFLWSKLSSKMRDLPTLNSFRNNIRKQDLTGFIS